MELLVIADVSRPETYHVGDEAMLDANLTGLRALLPDVGFTVISADPGWTAQHYAVRAIAPIGFPTPSRGTGFERKQLFSRVLRAAAAVRSPNIFQRPAAGQEVVDAAARCDGLLVSGGGNLCSTWPHHLYERVALIRIAHILEKPIVVTGQTLGPHLSHSDRDEVAAALPLAGLVIVRERSSYELALALGVASERLLFGLDDAFFMQAGQEAETSREPEYTRPWIAVTVAAFVEPATEPEKIRSLARQFDEIIEQTGLAMVFLPHVAGGEDVDPDAEVAHRLVACMKRRDAVRVIDVCLARNTRRLTGQASLVISSRYHPLVFGMSAGVPGFGIFNDEYSRVKIQGALGHAGLEEYSTPIAAALEGNLAAKVLALWRRREQVRHRLESLRGAWLEADRERWRRIAGALHVTPREGPVVVG